VLEVTGDAQQHGERDAAHGDDREQVGRWRTRTRRDHAPSLVRYPRWRIR
jgi:hypothetical protein